MISRDITDPRINVCCVSGCRRSVRVLLLKGSYLSQTQRNAEQTVVERLAMCVCVCVCVCVNKRAMKIVCTIRTHESLLAHRGLS